jgi:ribosome biogenesis GTPase A
MANFWKTLNKVLESSDIILIVMDARMPELTRNEELERKSEGKNPVHVLNKCDLVSKDEAERIARQIPGKTYFVSSTEYLGIQKLKTGILEIAGKMGSDKVVVGLVGYPNTGKSSLINALTSRSSAKTSAHAGFTKGSQLVRLRRGVYLLDTPGVIPYKEDDERKHGMIASANPNELKDPDVVAMDVIKKMVEEHPSQLESLYRIKIDYNADDEYDILLKIGKSLNFLSKGGAVDERRTAVAVVQDWQRGKLKL